MSDGNGLYNQCTSFYFISLGVKGGGTDTGIAHWITLTYLQQAQLG